MRPSQAPSWQFIEEAGSEIASRVLDLEEALHSASEDYVAVYEREINRQQERVAALAQDPVLRCGLAIANPQVARESARLIQKAGVLYGRREKRLVTTLLRYVSRAALKLSPFSTLTPTGLLTTAQGDDPLTLVKGAWQRRSLVRVRRHILDRCSDLLLRYDPWRRSLVVSLNDSAEQLEDGRTLFLRPSHYRLNEEKMKLEFQDESLVRVRIPLPLLETQVLVQARGPLLFRTHVSACGRTRRARGSREGPDRPASRHRIPASADAMEQRRRSTGEGNDPGVWANLRRRRTHNIRC